MQAQALLHLWLYIKHILGENTRSAVEGRSLKASLAIWGQNDFRGWWDPQWGSLSNRETCVAVLLLIKEQWEMQEGERKTGKSQNITNDELGLQFYWRGSLEKDHHGPHLSPTSCTSKASLWKNIPFFSSLKQKPKELKQTNKNFDTQLNFQQIVWFWSSRWWSARLDFAPSPRLADLPPSDRLCSK